MPLEKEIASWLNDYLLNNDLDSFIVGVSGGIDSAVTSTLCAITGCKTIVITMPIHQDQDETNRGMKHCSWLYANYSNIEILNIDLTSIYEQFISSIPDKFTNPIALANTRARIRMSTLYLIAGNSNGIVVGTGNKVEDFGVGFFTKYGDGGVDISPIADLMKSEVYDLGKKLNIIDSIIKAKPTDGLWDDGRTDEDQLGVSYDELEWAMQYNGEEIDAKQKEILNIYNKHRNANLHKMKDIPIFKKK
jgi:NAD+ synthase